MALKAIGCLVENILDKRFSREKLNRNEPIEAAKLVNIVVWLNWR